MSQPEKIVTTPLSGFMELLPAEQLAFNKMFDTIRRTYELFGFVPLDTPVLERAEVLLAKVGGETEKQIYQFKKGDTDLAMRFDLTVPLARYVAEHYGHLTFPFRRYAMGKVYRGERPQAGRFREFYQCDIDIIGDGELDIQCDAEIPSVIYMIFRTFGFERFTIRINNRKILNGLFASLGASDKSTPILQSLDRLEKIGASAVEQELRTLGLEPQTIERIITFTKISQEHGDTIAALNNMGITDAQFIKGVDELGEVMRLVKEFGVPASNVAADLTIARGLDYYTGTVYETRLDDYPDIGSVCSGGRFDDLASHYIDRKLPGVGISIGLTRLFDQLSKRGVVTTGAATPTRVLVLAMMDDMAPSLALATELRKNGIPTEVSFVQGKMKKRLGYADKLGIPYAVFIGENEVAKGVYTVKNLQTGTQEEVGLAELVARLK
jgi:histidyl-tRNA synthetase